MSSTKDTPIHHHHFTHTYNERLFGDAVDNGVSGAPDGAGCFLPRTPRLQDVMDRLAAPRTTVVM